MAKKSVPAGIAKRDREIDRKYQKEINKDYSKQKTMQKIHYYAKLLNRNKK
jgi:hypothetical protein